MRHIVALRGDPLAGIGERFSPHPGGYKNAADLVGGIKRIADIEVSVSAYPEKHPESATVADDIDMLKAKVDAGANRAITQFFFENSLYLRYLDRVRASGINIPIVPGILPVQNFKQTKSFAARTGASVPDWLARRFEGLDEDPATRKLIAAAVAAEQVLDLVDQGVTDFHFYTMNRADLVYAICHLLGLRPGPQRQRSSSHSSRRNGRNLMTTPSARATNLRELAADRILVLDGAMGTMIQALGLDERGYRGARFDAWNREVRGNNDLLNLSRPGAVHAIHLAYFRAGADIVSTNTFSSTWIAQADYGMGEIAYELNLEGAQLARRAAQAAQDEDGRPRFVAGAIGPTNRTASISPDVLNPGFRAITFDELRNAYTEQARGLIDGGVDVLLIETIFDTLNAKAAIFACTEVMEERGLQLPLMISGTITDRSGRLSRRADARGVLEFGRPRNTAVDRLQLRVRRQADAGARRRTGARRRHAHLRLSQCRTAQRVRPLRREPRDHGGANRRIRRCRHRQHRRRMLRHHARPHPRDRRRGRRQDAARRFRPSRSGSASPVSKHSR